eukprot:6085271-Pleurochrysis_carterae.AAC.1
MQRRLEPGKARRCRPEPYGTRGLPDLGWTYAPRRRGTPRTVQSRAGRGQSHGRRAHLLDRQNSRGR